MYNASDKRKIKYATDPEYRKKELQRVALAKTKKEFRDWQRQYNREYYHNKRKDKMYIIIQPTSLTHSPMNLPSLSGERRAGSPRNPKLNV